MSARTPCPTACWASSPSSWPRPPANPRRSGRAAGGRGRGSGVTPGWGRAGIGGDVGLGRCRGSGWLGAHGRFFLLLLILPTPPVGAARTGRAVGCGDLGCVCVIWGVCVILGCDSWHGNVAFGPYRRPRAPRPQQRQGEAAASPAALPKLSLRIWSPETASGGIPASGEILAASSGPRPHKEAGGCSWPPECHTAAQCLMLSLVPQQVSMRRGN